MNILYLSYDGMTDPLGQSQVLAYLEQLSMYGYKFHLISFEKKDRFQNEEKSVVKRCKEHNINWHPITYTSTPPVLSTVWDVFKMNRLAKKLHHQYNFQLIHSRSYISSIIALKLKKRFHIPFLFDMRGFWADERIEGKIWNLKNPLYKLIYKYFKQKEINFINKSNHIISLTENGKNEILKWNQSKITPDKISVIPCCVNLKQFDFKKVTDNEKMNIKNELNIKNNYILGYVGSIGTWYMLHEMLDFFKVLSQNISNAKFLFITKESEKFIKKIASSRSINEESIIAVSVPHNQVPQYISTFDSSVFFIKPSFSKKASSPTKQAELLAMKIPLICNSNVGDVESLVNNTQSGIVIQNFNNESYQKAIDQLLKSKNSFIFNNIDYFSLENGVNEYKKAYEKLLTN